MATVATVEDSTIVGDNEDQLVTMIVDNQLFGIPILQVQDIVEASKITPVPLAPSAIAGVLNLRGRIVTVIDLRKLLGNHEEVPWNSQMGVTIEYKGDLYTLLVDAIGDVRTLPKRDFDSSPSTMEDNVRKLCAGIYRLRGNLLVVLDVARILNDEVIEATPMLSVEDRRARKDAAVAETESGKSESQQLSALMTDLNAYESEAEGVFGADTGETADDIKARKRANRDRRPVAERWQEVLDEKARQTGKVTYRMHEPDEETVETAREDAVSEDEEWASRVKDPETEAPGADGDAPQPESAAGDAAPDLPEPEAWDDGMMSSGDDMPEAESELPLEDANLDAPESFKPEIVPDMPVDELPAEELPAEEAKTDIPELFEPEAPVEELPAEEPPVEETPVEELPAEEPPVEETPVEEAKTDSPDPFAIDDAFDMPAEEAKAETPDPFSMDDATDMPVEEAKSETPEPEKSEDGSGGTAGGWWDKLRGKKSGDESSDAADDKKSKAKAKKAKSKAKKTKSASKAKKAGDEASVIADFTTDTDEPKAGDEASVIADFTTDTDEPKADDEAWEFADDLASDEPKADDKKSKSKAKKARSKSKKKK